MLAAHPTGRRDRSPFSIEASLAFRDRRAYVYVSIKGPDAKSYFHLLHADKDEIERAAGFLLDWCERPDIQTSYIQVCQEVDLDDRSTWPAVHAWMLEHLLGLDRAFRPRISRLDAADWPPEGCEP